MTADEFICSVLDEFPDEAEIGLKMTVTAIKNRLRNPYFTWNSLLHTLETLSGNALPETTTRIRNAIGKNIIDADVEISER